MCGRVIMLLWLLAPVGDIPKAAETPLTTPAVEAAHHPYAPYAYRGLPGGPPRRPFGRRPAFTVDATSGRTTMNPVPPTTYRATRTRAVGDGAGNPAYITEDAPTPAASENAAASQTGREWLSERVAPPLPAAVTWPAQPNEWQNQDTIPPLPETITNPRAWPAPPVYGLAFPATCVEVVDGDTITAEVTFRVRLRLDTCWAPESRTTDLEEKKRGLVSKANMMSMALGKPLTVHIPGGRNIKTIGELSTLGRVVARAWVAGDPVSLSEHQVNSGNAATQKGLPVGQ